MRKIGLVTIICQLTVIGFTSKASAQTTPAEIIQIERQHYLGVKLQGVYSSATTSEEDDSELLQYRPTYGLGIQSFIGIDDRYNAQIEFLYIKRGLEIDFAKDRPDVDASATVMLTYLQMPLLGSMHLPMMGPISLKFLFGPYLSYLLSSKIRFDAQANGKEVTQTQDIDDISRVDVGVVVAPGINVALDQLLFNVDVRMDYGFIQFNEDASDELRNIAFSLNAGIMMAF